MSQLRDELDRDARAYLGEVQPGGVVRQVHPVMSGERTHTLQEDHAHRGDGAHPDAVSPAQLSAQPHKHTARLPQGVARALLLLRLRLGLRRRHVSGPSASLLA